MNGPSQEKQDLIDDILDHPENSAMDAHEYSELCKKLRYMPTKVLAAEWEEIESDPRRRTKIRIISPESWQI